MDGHVLFYETGHMGMFIVVVSLFVLLEAEDLPAKFIMQDIRKQEYDLFDQVQTSIMYILYSSVYNWAK